MMNPETVRPETIRAALESVRPPVEDLDDASLACILDHGVGALPTGSRSRALRAIGLNPAVATVVASLHDQAECAAPNASRTTLGWRMAFAACMLLATGATFWALNAGGHASPPPQLLDGSMPASEAPTGIRGPQLLGLMLAWLLAATCFVPAFVRPALAARRASSRPLQAGD
jgi:hypothetical protein